MVNEGSFGSHNLENTTNALGVRITLIYHGLDSLLTMLRNRSIRKILFL